MIKRTIIIWTEFVEMPYFYVVEDDVSKFNNVVVGTTDTLADELADLIWTHKGVRLHTKYESFPHHLYVPGVTAVITAGCVP